MTENEVKLLSWRCRVCGQQNYRPLSTEVQEGKIIPLVCRRCDTAVRETISSSNIIGDRRQRARV
ncbi:MAG: hypothetical protein M3S32_11120 [Acidobacteriota bacterium]|nr:hypothetical protein [Acidobacteriota bacterium]